LSTPIWNYRKTSVEKLARETIANHAINALYYYDLDIIHIDEWRICTIVGRSINGDIAHD
jgi:hypothetical protein